MIHELLVLQVTEYYAKDFKAAGGTIINGFKVKRFNKNSDGDDHPVTIVDTNNRRITSKYVLCCAGLQADIVAALTGNKNPPKIVPFRGEYLLLNPAKAHMVKGNIYPVPDPRFPFLGVHFTPRMDGSIWLGPNAVLAFKREGYRWADINLAELFDSLKYPGNSNFCFLKVRLNFSTILRLYSNGNSLHRSWVQRGVKVNLSSSSGFRSSKIHS